MTDSTNGSASDGGFVDYYQVLGEPPTASTDELRTRIDALYGEANANRDHRNPNKRREYQVLLEQSLPQARTVLLDDAKRAQYDAYAASLRAGTATQSFEAFLAGLSAKPVSAEKAGILGVQDTPAATSTPRRKKTAPSGKAKASLQGSLISVAIFFAIFIVLHLVLHHELMKSLAVAAIVAVVAWVGTHFGMGNKVSR